MASQVELANQRVESLRAALESVRVRHERDLDLPGFFNGWYCRRRLKPQRGQVASIESGQHQFGQLLQFPEHFGEKGWVVAALSFAVIQHDVECFLPLRREMDNRNGDRCQPHFLENPQSRMPADHVTR